MDVEIGTEGAQFQEKEYINGIFLAVWYSTINNSSPLGAATAVPWYSTSN
jgi:hypothetical protein